MITEVISKKQVEDVLADGGNFTKVGLAVFAENFFEYGSQNIHKKFYREEMEELLTNLEVNAKMNGDEVCGAVMGKAVLLTFTRRQVVTDALSYLARAAEKGVKGAAAQLCVWYSGRIFADDLGRFEDVDVGVDDCYNPTPEFPRQTFPRNIAECRRRLVYWLSKTSEEDFQSVRRSFSALPGSSFAPRSWSEGMDALAKFTDEDEMKDLLERSRKLIEEANGPGAPKQIALGAKGVRELAEQADYLDAWKYMLELHERKVGPFKTNKFRRDAKAAIARLEGK